MILNQLKKYSAYFFGTIAGAGYFPIAPGTFGSAIAILVIYIVKPGPIELGILIFVLFIIGLLSCGIIERNDGKDPGHIVIDEVAGQWLTFLFISPQNIFVLITGFFLFRLFDIFKPMGINQLQKLKSGWGVMLDDIFAAVYANIILQFIIYIGFIV
jgi:phosphatidylglycerophosphatase A